MHVILFYSAEFRDSSSHLLAIEKRSVFVCIGVTKKRPKGLRSFYTVCVVACVFVWVFSLI